MMPWYVSGMNGWGYAFMTVSMVLFWALIIFGVITLVRFVARHNQPTAIRPTPDQLLAERFAAGEIDEQEYCQRLGVLTDQARPLVRP